ncbi:MAG: threalose-6-phosphate phosphatase [Phylliscum demangeonii]|nr:MAG: threalose-6-phosphate phosphatase [Phylliscum demangeonii]
MNPGGGGPMADLQSAYPSLGLTGNLISATFYIPHQLGFRSGAGWELRPRAGMSALFESFYYLSSPASPWKHTLVGWTGEIKHASDYFTLHVSAGPATSVSARLKQIAAPIPVNGVHSQTATVTEGIRVTKEDRQELEKRLARDRCKTVPVWLADNVEGEQESGSFWLRDQSRWRRYAESELYTACHYKQHEPRDGRKESTWWADYCHLNKEFANRIIQIYKPGDLVWIHDYHLMLLPSLLRHHFPRMHIGFFFHAPFPSSEFVRCLAHRKEVLGGMLGANMIGFQAYGYSRHFSSSCTRILGFESSPAGVDAYGAHVAVEVLPIGINAEEVEKMAFGDAEVEAKVTRLRQMYAGKKVVVGRDRLDSARGVAQKLLAFETFLERYPQWRDRVILIQVTSPTTVAEEKDDSEYKLAGKVAELVSRINGRFGSLSFMPVHHFPQYLPKDEYYALMRVADVGLITSIRDGMNTIGFEYVICQKEHHGTLILSEFSGTASSLDQAMQINPWDLAGVSASIDRALQMTAEEKRAQHAPLYRYVTTNTVQAWSVRFIDRLLTNLSSAEQSMGTPLLDKAALLTQYRRAKRRLFMLDYDGTLTPIVQEPSAAIPTDRVIRTLKTLAADPRNAVWIVSGRDQKFLGQWMGDISELGLSAEHGSFLREPGAEAWKNLAEKLDMSWQKEVLRIFQKYTEKTQGSFIERKRIALTWHYRRSDPEYGAFQAHECRKEIEATVVKKWDVEVMAGKANLEVRPSLLNKGEIAKRLVERYDEHHPPEFVLCMGDDFTDEDMFRSLHATKLPRDRVFTVTIGASTKGTLAAWHLLEPADVIATLAMLNRESASAKLANQAAALASEA